MRFIREILTILVATLVTALIWAFAEAETLRQSQATVELVFEQDLTSDRQLSFRGLAAGVGNTEVLKVQVRLEGTNASVDEAERALRPPLRFRPYARSIPTTPGEHVLNLRDLIRAHPDLGEATRAIASVEPSVVPVVVDELIAREVDVAVVLPTGETDDPPEAKPGRVRVLCPKALASAMPQTLSVLARIDAGQMERLVPGRKETIPQVRLALPDTIASLKGFRIDPAIVDVSLVVTSRTPTSKTLSVPVQVVLATMEQSKWDITFDARSQFIADVTVTGPAEIVRQIEERKLPVVALLQLSFNELEGAATQSKEVVFTTLPPTQAPLKFDAPSKTVSFTISRRNGKPVGP